MSRILTALLALSVLAGCAATDSTPEPAACTAPAIWAGALAGAAAPACGDDPDLVQARFLGEAFVTLSGQLETLARREQAGTITGPERLEQVRLIRELEQIRGAAIVRGWEASPGPEDAPSPDSQP
ncbi:MAG: hypothetical protein AAGE01_11770 [Pseudomonadota bacterium]